MPFSAGIIVLCLAAHFAAGGFMGRLPESIAIGWGFQLSDLLGGQWWNAITSIILSSSTASMLLAVATVALLLGLVESTLGTRRTAALFIASQLAGIIVYSAMVGVGSRAGLQWPAGMVQATLLGPFAASVGALMAASQAISVLWRRRLRVLVVAGALMLTVYVGHAQHIFILVTALAGLILGRLLIAAVGQGVVRRSTSREVRTNLALVVAVLAIGPVAAAVAHVPVGPLAVLRGWITSQNLGAAQANCPPGEGECLAALHNIALLSSGGHLLALMPMVLLLVCAEGLRRGNRLALWAAVYLHVVIGVVSAIYFQVFAGFGLPLRRGHRALSINESVWELLPVVLVPLVIAALLVIYRRHFSIDPDPALRRRSLVLLPLLLLAFVGLYSVAWFAEGNLSGPHGIGGLVASLPRIVLPYPFPWSYVAAVYPHGFFSSLLFSMGGPVLWLLSAFSILAVFLSRRTQAGESDARQTQQLVRLGGDSLSWMTLWANNQYWFNSTGTVAVAYQAHNGVAVTVGGPVGLAQDYVPAMDEFLDFCAEESLTPCFYSVTQAQANPLLERDFRSIVVAQETLLDVHTMNFKGKDWQNVRTALNKAAKLGVRPLWCSYGELTSAQRTAVNEISEDWVSAQALPELGFTLGGLEELKNENVQLCLAIDDSGHIHAVTSWLPVFSNGEVVSWTLDFMRRNSEAFNGVMEYLIAQAVNHFAETVEYISLSGSPLANSEEQDSSLGRILALLARTLEPVYGFASLANFKQRFQPRHRPLYLMYQDPLSLPAIGRAVGEAYMPNVSVRTLAKVLRKP
ncbi:phosphatidylglycerol lysyltransferase domain-containing protein [Arthrobacter sp. HLT1-20]